MRFVAIQGKNNKKFIKLILEDKNDLKVLERIRTIVSRTEYLPFIKSFNKNITESYLLQETYVPAQFWWDIREGLEGYLPDDKIICEGFQDIIMNREIHFQDIIDYVETVNLPDYIDLFDEAYKYQLQSVYRAIAYQTARIQIATGGGKTLISYLYLKYLIDKLNVKKCLVVINRTSLVRQTAQEFENWEKLQNNEESGNKPLIISTIYSKGIQQENSNVIIGTYQSLRNYDNEWFDDFECILLDEAHSAKAYSIRNDIYGKSKNLRFILGMTATWPEYKSIDYLNCVAMMGPLVYNKTIQEAIQDKNIVDIFVKRLIINYSNPEDNDFCKNLWNNDIRGIDKYRAEKAFFERYQKRNQLIADIIKKLNNNSLILVESVDFALFLKEFISQECEEKCVELIYGGVKIDERNEILSKMEQQDNMVLIGTYETLSTGVNIKNLHYIFFPNSGKSQFRVLQGIGRGVRKNDDKDKVTVFDFVDNLPMSTLKGHGNERKKIYIKEKINFKDIEVTI